MLAQLDKIKFRDGATGFQVAAPNGEVVALYDAAGKEIPASHHEAMHWTSVATLSAAIETDDESVAQLIRKDIHHGNATAEPVKETAAETKTTSPSPAATPAGQPGQTNQPGQSKPGGNPQKR
jgi:hypothetical protein